MMCKHSHLGLYNNRLPQFLAICVGWKHFCLVTVGVKRRARAGRLCVAPARSSFSRGQSNCRCLYLIALQMPTTAWKLFLCKQLHIADPPILSWGTRTGTSIVLRTSIGPYGLYSTVRRRSSQWGAWILGFEGPFKGPRPSSHAFFIVEPVQGCEILTKISSCAGT